jgi:tetratricopeptide (TPR) repeat protein
MNMRVDTMRTDPSRSRLWRSGVTWLLALVLCGSFAAPALSQPEAAEKKSAEGRVAYDSGDFAKALVLFKEAYRLHPGAKYLFNCAKACGRLEDYEGAIYYDRQYLAASPNAPDKGTVEAEISRFAEILGSRGLTAVDIACQPAGARISVAPARHSEAEQSPATLFLPEGSHTVTCEKAGYLPARALVTLAMGAPGPGSVRLHLEKEPEPIPGGPEGDGASGWRTAALVTAGTAVAVAVAGGVVYGLGWSAADGANSDWNALSQKEKLAPGAFDEYDSDYRAAGDNMELGSVLLYSGLGVAAAAAVAWLVLPDASGTAPAATVMPMPSGGATAFFTIPLP